MLSSFCILSLWHWLSWVLFSQKIVMLLNSCPTLPTSGTALLPCRRATRARTLPNAADLGDCTSSLPSGDSCRNTGISGYSCTVSICNDGVLSPGNCVEGVIYAIGPVQSSCDGNNLGTVHTREECELEACPPSSANALPHPLFFIIDFGARLQSPAACRFRSIDRMFFRKILIIHAGIVIRATVEPILCLLIQELLLKR